MTMVAKTDALCNRSSRRRSSAKVARISRGVVSSSVQQQLGSFLCACRESHLNPKQSSKWLLGITNRLLTERPLSPNGNVMAIWDLRWVQEEPSRINIANRLHKPVLQLSFPHSHDNNLSGACLECFLLIWLKVPTNIQLATPCG